MASHHQGNGEGRRSSTRAEVLRAMALAASSHDAPAGEDRGGAAGASSDRARANRTMSADINMSNRLNHLVRAEEAELQQLDINDPDSPRYAHDINTGGGIGGHGASALAREVHRAPGAQGWLDSPKQPASPATACTAVSMSTSTPRQCCQRSRSSPESQHRSSERSGRTSER